MYQIRLRGDNRIFLLPLLLHPNPTFRSAPMAGIPTDSKDMIESKPGGGQNNKLETLMELNQWWKTALEISAGIESPEAREKFKEFVKSEREWKDQVRKFYETLVSCVVSLHNNLLHRHSSSPQR